MKEHQELIAMLPKRCSERVTPLNHAVRTAANGDFVLVWLRTAVRTDHNPLLDTAIELSNQLDKPVFIYHAVSERYPYASDRHHTFILQSARDFAQDIERRGVGYAFHLERPGHRGPHLKTLANRAAIVLTDDFPAPPLDRWSQALASHSTAPVWAVDAMCIAPQPLVDRWYDRAYKFRNAALPLAATRIAEGWIDSTPVSPCPGWRPDNLPFEPIPIGDASDAQLAFWVAECEIDHTVGPVPDTPGGMNAARARWTSFRDGGGLKQYARKRNDAATSGVSRMSAYFHYGNISALEVARDCYEADPSALEKKKYRSGPGKYLDELFVWRELAFNLCRHAPADLHSLQILPDWARETLQRHAIDPRSFTYSWETLARGESDSELWNLAQRSLLSHGELHNNIRMTWGKAIPFWTPDPLTALEMLIDLNHRYALDGRDPASYAGLLWCLGLADRPFEPEKPVLGSVRPRSLARHTARLDVDKYKTRVRRTPSPDAPRVAVVGAGMSGLFCARTLADHSLSVTVFDKARGPGGRTCTRRSDDLSFDHGAQYFTQRDPRLSKHAQSWLSDGVIGEWQGKIGVWNGTSLSPKDSADSRYVGTPSMSALAKHLADGLERAGGGLSTGTRIASLERALLPANKVGWRLRDTEGVDRGIFDEVVLALPSAQAAELLEKSPHTRSLAEEVSSLHLSPCWAVMLAFDSPLECELDGIFVNGESPVAWAARNSSKPGRDSAETWVLHATSNWSREHLEESADTVVEALTAAFEEVVGPLPIITHQSAHRWRYAQPSSETHRRGCIHVPDLRLGLCGDWLNGGRVEGALLSGAALAGRILGQIQPVAEPVQSSLFR